MTFEQYSSQDNGEGIFQRQYRNRIHLFYYKESHKHPLQMSHQHQETSDNPRLHDEGQCYEVRMPRRCFHPSEW